MVHRPTSLSIIHDDGHVSENVGVDSQVLVAEPCGQHFQPSRSAKVETPSSVARARSEAAQVGLIARAHALVHSVPLVMRTMEMDTCVELSMAPRHFGEQEGDALIALLTLVPLPRPAV